MYEMIEKIKERRKNTLKAKIEREQCHILDDIQELNATSEEYKNALANMEPLTKAKEVEKKGRQIDANTGVTLITQVGSMIFIAFFTTSNLLPRDVMPFFHKIGRKV